MPEEAIWGFALTIVGIVMFAVIVIAVIQVVMKAAVKGFAGGYGKQVEMAKAAAARIIKIEQGRMKMTVGGVQEYWRPTITLLVEPRDESSFETTVQHVVSVLDIPQYQPGTVVVVAIDKKDKTNVTILQTLTADLSTMKAPEGQKDKAEKILIDHQVDYVELSNIGVKAEADITGVEETQTSATSGKLRNLRLKVFPQDGEPFEAASHALILESSLDKYVVGARLNVAFDANDKTRVTILGRTGT